MSSLSASLCLFSAALCNVAVLDQRVFEGNPQDQQVGQQQIGDGALVNAAANLYGSFLNGFNGKGNAANRQGQGQGQGHGNGHGNGHGQGNNKQQRQPHQSPCPNKFQYVTDGRQWKGIIRLKNIDVNKHTRIEAEFVLPHGMQRRVIFLFICKCNFNAIIFLELSRKH